MDLKRYGPWALIVGGSEGVGAAFARRLANDGFNLLLVARKPEPLAALVAEIGQASGVEVRTSATDLAAPNGLDTVVQAGAGLEVGLLIYNAGANSTRGRFIDLEPEVYRQVIAVNVLGPAELIRRFGAAMAARGRGGIITTGSLSGYVGTATLAAYCGAMAFSRVFTEALWAECAEVGVDVLHLGIGYTATPAMERLRYDLTSAMSADQVAYEGLQNIGKGPVVICGGPERVAIAEERSRFARRGELVRSISAPPRL